MKLLSIIFASSALFLLISALAFLGKAVNQINLQETYRFLGPGACMLVVSVILGICSAASFKAS